MKIKSRTKKKAQSKKKQTTIKPTTISQALVTVPISEIQKVETYKGKMSVVPTPFTELQIKHLVSPTPKNVILQRPGKGGKSFDYIPGWYFKKKLNFTFGWMHDFEILGERIDGKFVTVKGKLTIKNAKGQVLVSKTDFGGHPIQFLKDKPSEYLDISNDFKAAATDCLKRCAVQLGIGLDVYSAGEYNNPQQPEAPISTSATVQERVSNYIPAQVVSEQELDYKKALDTLLIKLGAKTEIEKLRMISKHTLLKYNDYNGIAAGGAKSIFLQIKKKTGK